MLDRTSNTCRLSVLGSNSPPNGRLPRTSAPKTEGTSVMSQSASQPDVVIRNGMIYDGSGGAPYQADLSMTSGKICAIGGDIPAGKDRQSV